MRLGAKPGIIVELPARVGIEGLKERIGGAGGVLTGAAMKKALAGLGCTGLWLTLDRMNRRKKGGTVDVLEILWADEPSAALGERGVALGGLCGLDRLIWQTVAMEVLTWHGEHYSDAGYLKDVEEEMRR